MLFLILGFVCNIVGYTLMLISSFLNTRKAMLTLDIWMYVVTIFTHIFWEQWFGILLSCILILRNFLAIKYKVPHIIPVIFALVIGLYRTLSHESSPLVYLIQIILGIACTGILFYTRNVNQLRICGIVEMIINYFCNIITGYHFVAFICALNAVILSVKLFLDKDIEPIDETANNKVLFH